MRRVKILVDSCADLNSEQLCKYGIDYVRMTTIYEGKETPAELTWSKEEAHALYSVMRDGGRVMTAQVSVEEFKRAFKKYLDLGMDVVYIACASKQSGSVNTGFVVAASIMNEYPGSKVICIDSYNASIGIGMLAIEAAKMAESGADASAIEGRVISLRNKVNAYVTVHSLDALRRAGRVKGAAAFFGNLMGVKPIIISDANGTQAAYKKVKGRMRSFEEIVSLLKETVEVPEEQTVYVSHADCSEEEVNTLVEIIKREIPCKEVSVGFIGPIVGASVGPDAIGVFAFGKEVTFKIGD